MIIEKVSVGPMSVNCYILAPGKGGGAIIIDPGDDDRKIRNVLNTHGLSASFIVNTHGHYDHIGADDKFGVPVYVHRLDYPMLKDPMLNLSGLFSLPFTVNSKIDFLEDGQEISLDDIVIKVMHTPGHTQGGITLVLEKPLGKIAFTGDTLFCQGVGRHDLPGGSEDDLSCSINKKIFSLSPETIIYPGHGEDSTVGLEKKRGLI